MATWRGYPSKINTINRIEEASFIRFFLISSVCLAELICMPLPNFRFVIAFVMILACSSCMQHNDEAYQISIENKAIISFIFDDLNASDTVVKSIFDEYHLQPSFALISNNLTPYNVVRYQQYADEGISILSHTVSHPKMDSDLSLSYPEFYHEIIDSRNKIARFDITVKGLVTPYQTMHPNFVAELEGKYDYAFTRQNNNLYDHSVHKHHLGRIGIESNISPIDHNIEKIKIRIDSAIVRKELLFFYGHEIPSEYVDNMGQPKVNEHDLRKILDYLQERIDQNECVVLTADKAVEAYYP